MNFKTQSFENIGAQCAKNKITNVNFWDMIVIVCHNHLRSLSLFPSLEIGVASDNNTIELLTTIINSCAKIQQNGKHMTYVASDNYLRDLYAPFSLLINPTQEEQNNKQNLFMQGDKHG